MANQRIYKGRAVSWGLGTTEKGNPQIAVTFVITTAGADLEEITWYGYFTDKTEERTIQSLRYCGWQGDDFTNLDGMNENEVELVIEDEDYQGKTYTKVKWVNRPGGSAALKAPLAGNALQEFAARMRSKVRAIDAANGAKKVRSGAVSPEPPPHSDADFNPTI
jgi:hypothetical protein